MTSAASTIQSDLDYLKREIFELKRSQISIAKSIIAQVNDNQSSTDQLLNILNTNMVTIFNVISQLNTSNILNSVENQKREQFRTQELDRQLTVIKNAQRINTKLRKINGPPKLKTYSKQNGVVSSNIQNPAQAALNMTLLEEQLRTRKNIDHLVDSGILLNSNKNFESKTSALERQQQMDILNRNLRNRPHRSQLLDDQLMYHNFDEQKSNLQRAQRRDSISRALRTRPAVGELVQQRILPDANNAILAANLNARKLKYQKANLNAQLQQRPGYNQLVQQGIMRNTAANFNDQKSAFERSQQMDILSRGLRNRPPVHELVDRNVLPDARNPLLAAQLNQKKKHQQMLLLDDWLPKRRPQQDLLQQGIMYNTRANYNFQRNVLEDNLRNRPAMNELVNLRVLPDARNPILAANLNQRRMVQSAFALEEQLGNRATTGQMIQMGYLRNTAPNFANATQQLQLSVNRDMLNRSWSGGGGAGAGTGVGVGAGFIIDAQQGGNDLWMQDID